VWRRENPAHGGLRGRERLADARPGGEVLGRGPEHDQESGPTSARPAFYTPGGHRRYKRDLEAFLERSGPGKPARGPLVLLVDDDPQVREVVRINLEMEGYAVREAANAEDGLAALEDEAPDSSCST